MFKSRIALALVFGILTSISGQAANNPPSHRGDLIHTNKPFERVGGDRVIFGYKVAPSCDVEALKQAAINLKNRTSTDRWDDLWYAFSVPRGRCLMIGWYNLDSSKYGWAAVQNQPNTWSARSAKRDWENMPNGTQKKFSFTVNGQKVDLDIFNPQNTNGLDGNDILISFGF